LFLSTIALTGRIDAFGWGVQLMSASEPTAVPRPWPDLQTIVDPMIKAFMLQTNTPGAIVSVQINARDHHSLSGHPSGAPVAGYERG